MILLSMLLSIIVALLLYEVCGEEDNRPTLHILTHHKLGIELVRSIVKQICPDKNNKNCNNKIIIHEDGLDSTITSYDPNNSIFIHTLRHPLDLLVSNYIIHRNCNNHEAIWTNAKCGESNNKLLEDKMIPIEFPLRNTGEKYCQWLLNHIEHDGLRLELQRLLHAYTGLGKIFKDMNMLINERAKVFNLCMSSATHSATALEEFIKPYNIYNNSLELYNEIINWSQPNNLLEHRKLIEVAFKMISEEIPGILLTTFPCSSMLYSPIATSHSYLFNLAVDSKPVEA